MAKKVQANKQQKSKDPKSAPKVDQKRGVVKLPNGKTKKLYREEEPQE